MCDQAVYLPESGVLPFADLDEMLALLLHPERPDHWCNKHGEMIMAWTTPTLVEICIGLEINGYLPAEF